MSVIEVKEVTTNKMMRAFVQFPLDLYKNEPKYIPSLFGDEMKLFNKKKSIYTGLSKTRFFLCYKDGALAGRVAGIVLYPYMEKTGRKILRFSRIDFIDDFGVCRALFDAIERFAREESLSEIHGPMGYTDIDREGLLVEGFEYASTFAAAYTYDYYPALIERCGFKKEVDWVEFLITLPSVPDARNTRIAGMVAKRFKLREAVDGSMSVPRVIDKYRDKLFELLNESYNHLHGTIPLTKELVDDLVKQFKLFLIPDFFSLIVNENDDIVGFGFALSSIAEELVRNRGKLSLGALFRLLYLKHHPKTAELALIGVSTEFKKKGVNAMIIDKISRGLIKHNITTVETNLELETNQSIISMWDGVETKFTKRRRCYLKQADFAAQDDIDHKVVAEAPQSGAGLN